MQGMNIRTIRHVSNSIDCESEHNHATSPLRRNVLSQTNHYDTDRWTDIYRLVVYVPHQLRLIVLYNPASNRKDGTGAIAENLLTNMVHSRLMYAVDSAHIRPHNSSSLPSN